MFTISWREKKDDTTSKAGTTDYTYEKRESALGDAGVYQFVCSDFGSGEKIKATSGLCTVSVRARPERQVKPLRDTQVKEGEPIELSVAFDKRVPLDDIKCSINGTAVSLATQPHIKLAYDEPSNTFTLRIERALPDRDSATYKIATANTASECRVQVKRKPQPSFHTPLADVRVKLLPDVIYATAGAAAEKTHPRSAQFQATLSSAHTAVTWLVDGRPVQDTVGRASLDDSSRVHSLLMADCGLFAAQSVPVELRLLNADDGSATTTSSRAVLTIERLALDHLVKFIKPLGDTLRLNEKQPAYLDACVSLDPILASLGLAAPTVRWLKDGVPLPAELSSSSKNNSNTMSVALSVAESATLADQGEYSVQLLVGECVAAASLGKLVVREEPVRLLRPLPAKLVVDEGEPLELECEANKANLPVEWTKDGKVLKPSSNTNNNIQMTSCYVEANAAYAYRLRLTRCEAAKDAGKYRIKFIVPSGADAALESECRVSVREPRLAVRRALDDEYWVREGQDAHMSAEFTRPLVKDEDDKSIGLVSDFLTYHQGTT